MTVSNIGRSGLALAMAGSIAGVNDQPRWLAIGTGSGANSASLGSLVTEALSARVDFTSRDIATVNRITQVWDRNSTNMSGLSLKEFGIGPSGAVGQNNLWLREGFTAVTFDGTQELQVQVELQTF